MKTYRYIVLFSMFLVLSSTAIVRAAAAGESYPDFLGDEMSTNDALDTSADIVVSDPLEPLNRSFFQFNDKLYFWVLKPVSKGYSWVLPQELRECVDNFFLNLATPIRFLNALLQGNMEKSGAVLGRFLINSTVGIYGLVDVAESHFGISPRRGDFGQTLGKWGMGEGIYFCWPIVGPSNVRDSVGLVADSFSQPLWYFYDNRLIDVSYYSTEKVNTLSLHPNVYEDLKKFSVDPYVASRQAYYEYRKAIIENE